MALLHDCISGFHDFVFDLCNFVEDCLRSVYGLKKLAENGTSF